MSTKRQIVADAYDALGLASYVFDLQPDQIISAVRKLDAMMALWGGRGIRLGYALASDDTTDPDQESGLPASAMETVVAQLAMRIGPTVGKTVPLEVLRIAKDGYNGLLGKAAIPNEVRIQSMPRGQGAKVLDDPFTDDTTEPLAAGPADGQFGFN